MRLLPISKSSFIEIAVPIVLPMLVVVALLIPVRILVLDLVKALMSKTRLRHRTPAAARQALL